MKNVNVTPEKCNFGLECFLYSQLSTFLLISQVQLFHLHRDPYWQVTHSFNRKEFTDSHGTGLRLSRMEGWGGFRNTCSLPLCTPQQCHPLRLTLTAGRLSPQQKTPETQLSTQLNTWGARSPWLPKNPTGDGLPLLSGGSRTVFDLSGLGEGIFSAVYLPLARF